MSYQAIDQLTGDPAFNGRVKACATQQAETYRNDARPPFVALANELLRTGGGDPMWAFIRITAAGPGIAAAAGDPPDQAAIPDDDILASVQANWETVADLFFDPEGTPIDV